MNPTVTGETLNRRGQRVWTAYAASNHVPKPRASTVMFEIVARAWAAAETPPLSLVEARTRGPSVEERPPDRERGPQANVR